MRSSTVHAARGARWTIARGALALGLTAAVAQPASAQLPDAETFLEDLGFSADQIAQVKAGSFVEGTIQASNERELVAALAFLVQTSPTALVNQMREDVLDRVDSNTIAFGVIEGGPGLASFAKLTLQPDGAKRAKAYADAGPDGDLNLSAQEIAAFDALGSAPTPGVAGCARVEGGGLPRRIERGRGLRPATGGPPRRRRPRRAPG